MKPFSLFRLCAPLEFRPPECFSELSSNGVDGVPFDMWTFGLLAAGALAGQWPQMQITFFEGWSWHKHVQPVLEKALNVSNASLNPVLVLIFHGPLRRKLNC